MTMSAIQAYEAHVAALAGGDITAVVAGYAEDAVLASNAGIGSGHDYIRSVFAQFLLEGSQIDPTTHVYEQDDVVFVTWTAGSGESAMSGADTFVVRDGLITAHTGFIAGPRQN